MSLPRVVEIHERPVSLRGSALARALLRLAGWRLLCDGLPARQGVIVVYPHTSNWDFPIGLLAKWAIGLPASFWGKDSLFEVPLFGRWLRWVGGLPVVRSSPQGLVGDMVQQMRQAAAEGRFLWLVVAPEGTRSRTEGWKSGFYRVAVGAGVPVGLATIDFGRREVGLDSFWQPGGDIDADFGVFAERLGARRGRLPRLAGPIRPLETRTDRRALTGSATGTGAGSATATATKSETETETGSASETPPERTNTRRHP